MSTAEKRCVVTLAHTVHGWLSKPVSLCFRALTAEEGRRVGSGNILGVIRDILSCKHADQVATYILAEIQHRRIYQTVCIRCRATHA